MFGGMYGYRRDRPEPVTRQKGVKQVFNNSMVCHVWAQQTQAYGRNSTGSIYFVGPSIFSYGSHFEMARFVRQANGQPAVLITNRTYSVTTSGHLSDVRGAIPGHISAFTVGSFTDHDANLSDLIQEAIDAHANIRHGKHPDAGEYRNDLDRARGCIEKAHDYMRAFNLKPAKGQREAWKQMVEGTYLTDEDLARWKARADERERKRQWRWEHRDELRQQRDAEMRAEFERKHADALARWTAGEDVHLNRYVTYRRGWGIRGFYSIPMKLRIRQNTVETTHGAEVPILEARKLYRAWKAGLNLEGRHVGHFTVNKMNGETITIGCHTIPFSEVERIAPELLAWRKERMEPDEPEPTDDKCEHCGSEDGHTENCYALTQETH